MRPAAVGGLGWLLAMGAAGLLAALLAAPAAAAPVVLYDGSVTGQTLVDQGFVYGAQPQPGSAQFRYADGGTTLDTTPAMGDMAGFAVRPGLVPPLARDPGLTVRFTVQVLAERHETPDRAGLSLVLVTSDLRGIELGMWSDRVWAQNDGAALFTQGEGAPLDLAAGPVALALTVAGDRYRLEADGVPVLEGPLRSYAVAGPPYNLPNFFFLGDNSSRAAALARLLFVSVEVGAPGSPTTTPSPTTTATPTASPTASATATPTASPTASATATPTASPTAIVTPTATATASPPRAAPPVQVFLPLLTR